MEKIEENGRGTPNQHQQVRKSGRENKEVEGKERGGEMEKYGKDRGEERRNTKPVPAGEKEWNREQGDGRKMNERWKR
jgi:hypothetical protein